MDTKISASAVLANASAPVHVVHAHAEAAPSADSPDTNTQNENPTPDQGQETDPETDADDQGRSESDLEAEPEPKKDDRFASKFAALTRRERALTQKEKAFKEREKQIQEQASKFEDLRDPVKYLDHLGMSFEQFADAILSGKKLEEDPETRAMKKIEEWERKQKEKEETEKSTRLSAQVEEAKQTIKKQIVDLGDKFELINSSGDYELVYEVIQTYFDQNREKVQDPRDAILSVEKAAEMVEAHIEREIEARFSKSKKFRSKFGQPPAPKSDEPAPDVASVIVDRESEESDTIERETSGEPVSHKTQKKTLTNSMGSQGTDPDFGRDLSPEERLKKAASLIKWTK